MISTTLGLGDALLLDRRLVLRIDRYDEHALVASLSTVTGRPVRTFGILSGEWVDITERVRMQYEGLFYNPKCQPADLAWVVVEIRYHAFADAPVHDSAPW